ncbi:polypeptide N-acetylgalactosaminyltransferase 13-like [Saccoglossus kowalevskii]
MRGEEESPLTMDGCRRVGEAKDVNFRRTNMLNRDSQYADRESVDDTRNDSDNESNKQIDSEPSYLYSEYSSENSPFQLHYFNVTASDKLSLTRHIPDTRHTGCANKTYSHDLPKTSIIICFHNEAWSTLLRTVHTCLDRAPFTLILEVLLVDDHSDLDYLKTDLDDYFKSFTNVRIIRTSRREGLIRARLIGAHFAKGEVLTFLDSHCECNTGWLEPMLQRIAKDDTVVVEPIIDIIDDRSFAYIGASESNSGGFTWQLQHQWVRIPEYEQNRRVSEYDNIRTPTMAGGLFSINKTYFEKMGAYDTGMDVWGGENIEMSFRIWMCGGKIEIIPCSRIGHVYRRYIPYSFPNGSDPTIYRNAMRVAEVWMDHYKKFFYATQTKLHMVDYGDVSDRLELRRKLGCHNFTWYLKNIIPEMILPVDDANYFGEIRNDATGLCLDSASGKPLRVDICAATSDQIFTLTSDHQLRIGKECLMKDDFSNRAVRLGQQIQKIRQLEPIPETKRPVCHPLGGLPLGVLEPNTS